MKKMLSVLDAPVPTRIKSKYDFANHKAVWTTKQKSLTFPNRTMTLRQIADRFAAGLQTIDEKVALYDDGKVVIKDLVKFDITERMEILKEAEKQMHAIIHKKQLEIREKHNSHFSQILEKEVEKRLAELEAKKKKEAAVNGLNE